MRVIDEQAIAVPAGRILYDASSSRKPLADWFTRDYWSARDELAVAPVGVHHADLNAHNILLADDGAVYVLDFDRGRIRARGAWENNVLARLHRSLV